jgi:N-acetylglucosaminyldiphosphoundecaprenol N-acetyl-beta-D-mannosaminyltransferase
LKILNINNLAPSTMEELVDFCAARAGGDGAFLVAMNPIKVVKARSRPDFQEIIDGADRVFPDAWGMKWAAGILHGADIELLPGWQVMVALIERAARDGRSVFFLGTTDEILTEAITRLQAQHRELRVAGRRNGFYEPGNEEEVFADVAAADPSYVFVAMGEYRQEQVISRLRPRLPGAVMLGVGGSVDVVAGRQPMPPAWIRRRHLEWLYRFFRQPFRIPRFRALPIFAGLVVLAKAGLIGGGR